MLLAQAPLDSRFTQFTYEEEKVVVDEAVLYLLQRPDAQLAIKGIGTVRIIFSDFINAFNTI